METFKLTFITKSILDDIRTIECTEHAMDDLVEIYEDMGYVLINKQLLDSSNT